MFAGHFEPCCRSGRFGTRGDQAGTSIIYNGDNHQVVTTASARVFTPEGENAEPGVRPDATDLLDAPPLDTLRFYHGTSATDAFAIIKEGARAFGDDKDFGAGFYSTWLLASRSPPISPCIHHSGRRPAKGTTAFLSSISTQMRTISCRR